MGESEADDSDGEDRDRDSTRSRAGTAFGRGPPADRSPRDQLAFGVVNLDKPPGPSAHQVSAWVRDLAAGARTSIGGTDDPIGIDRAAHAGTLDPKVTGCLPVLLGTATRIAQALATPKEYVAVLECHRRAPENTADVLREFEAPIYQKPPRKSAVARRLRVREVYGLDVLDREPRRVLLRIRCESGTYVRKLCHDIGLALGTGAHMGDLRRTRADPFDDRDLVTLQEVADALAFAAASDFEVLREIVQPAERALVHLPRLTVAHSAAREVANGAPVYAPGVLGYEPPEQSIAGSGGGESEPKENDGNRNDRDGDESPLVACYTPDGAAVCLGELVGDPDAKCGTVLDTQRVLL